jgi:hypothetical protein
VLGWIAEPPGAAPSTLVDWRHMIEVTLANAAMELADADASGLDGGANLAMAGDELVQFGRAQRIGPARWRLSELWRGRRGTENAVGMQATGDRFVLLDPTTLVHFDLPLGRLGTEAQVMAAGVGDGSSPPIVAVPVSGASILPPSPVHLRAGIAADGALSLQWVRRSRGGWRWLDGVDAPLGEERELYRLSFESEPLSRRATETIEPILAIAADDVPSGATAITVRQIGSYGASPAARVELT